MALTGHTSEGSLPVSPAPARPRRLGLRYSTRRQVGVEQAQRDRNNLRVHMELDASIQRVYELRQRHATLARLAQISNRLENGRQELDNARASLANVQEGVESITGASSSDSGNAVGAASDRAGQLRMNLDQLLRSLELLATLGPPMGIREEQIDNHTMVMKLDAKPSVEAKSSDEGQATCMVCLEEFEVSQKLRVLPCFHRYHIGCIDPWLKRNRRCPVCKHDVKRHEVDAGAC